MNRPQAADSAGETDPSDSPRSVQSMGALARSAARRARQAHAARAVCGGLGASLLTLSAAVYGGAPLAQADTLALAGGVGALAFFTWIRSRRVDEREVICRVDDRLHLGGAFLAAKESCEERPDSIVTQLGAAKLLMRVRPGQVMEAAIPHTLGFTLLPLVSLVLFVSSISARDARFGEAGRVHVEVGALTEHLDRIAEAHSASMAPEASAQLEGAQVAAEKAASAAAEASLGRPAASEPGGASEPGQDPDSDDPSQDWRDDLRDVADNLEALARAVPPGSDLARELGDAAAQAEALAMESEVESAEYDRDTVDSEDARIAAADVEDDPSEAASVSAGSNANDGSVAAADPGSGNDGARVPKGADGSSAAAGSTDSSREPLDPEQVSQNGDPTPDRPVGSPRPAQGATGMNAGPTVELNAGGAEAMALEGLRRWWSEEDDPIVRAWIAASDRR